MICIKGNFGLQAPVRLIFLFTKELAEKLNQKDRRLLWKYSDEPNEKHKTIFRATKEKALIWTLNE